MKWTSDERCKYIDAENTQKKKGKIESRSNSKLGTEFTYTSMQPVSFDSKVTKKKRPSKVFPF